MMPAVRASGLAVSSASMAQICPAYGEPSRLGQWISASGTCTPLAGPPVAARMRRSLRHHAWPVLIRLPAFQPEPDGEDGADVGQAAEGRAGWRGSRGRWLSSRSW